MQAPWQKSATTMLKVACANPDAANQLTGRICIYDHLVNIRKGICIPIRCVKCQEYSHIQDSCIGVEKCSNCTSEFHSSDECDRSTSCVSCGPGSQHPSTPPFCPSLMRKCDVLNKRFPKNAMPYFPSRDSWTWAALPTNPMPPQKAPLPLQQQADQNHCSIHPNCQKPCRSKVSLDVPPSLRPQEHEVDNDWTTVHQQQISPSIGTRWPSQAYGVPRMQLA